MLTPRDALLCFLFQYGPVAVAVGVFALVAWFCAN